MIQFCYDHPEIAAIWTFGLNDTVRSESSASDTSLNSSDLPYFAALSKSYQEALDPPSTDAEDEEESATEEEEDAESEIKLSRPSNDSALGATKDGAMSEWASHQFGVVALSSSLWPGPVLPNPTDGGLPNEDETLALLERSCDVRAGLCTVRREVEHPTLGTVEVGGWKPVVRINPPSEILEEIAEAQFRFLDDPSVRFARLAITDVQVKEQGGRVFEVTASVVNEGYFPTALVRGETTRQASPVVVRLELGKDCKLLAGSKLSRISSLEGSGGIQEYQWLIFCAGGTEIKLNPSCPRAGNASTLIELPE